MDGLQVFYREAGSPASPTIVLLHGAWSSSHMFRDLIPRLAPSFHVVAPDLIGFGYSDAPPRDRFTYTFDALARVTDRFLAALDLRRYVLYMHDYGGPVGFRLARMHPGRVAGLVVQNANAYLEGIAPAVLETLQPLWTGRTPATETAARDVFSVEGVKYQYLAGARDPSAVSPDAWTLDLALLQRPGNVELQLDLLADYGTNVASYPQWQAYFRRHRPKTLIVWGRNDPIFLAPGAEAYRRDLPDAELVWLDGGHFALEEFAPEIAGHIVRVFAKPGP